MHASHQQRIEELESSTAKTYETAPSAANFRNNRMRRAVLKEQLAAARAEAGRKRDRNHD